VNLQRVNIITPTYNDAHIFLIDTILSVQRQVENENKFEIIHTIIDDGSTNKDSLDFLNKIEKIKSINILHQTNKGLASARNTGINSVPSDYIIPLDSDDLINPCYVDILITKLKSTNKKKAISYSNWVSFGRYKRFIKVRKTNPYSIRFANYLPVSVLIPTLLALEYPYDEMMLKGCEDWDLWIRLICNGCFMAHSNFFGFYHREHFKNMTSSTLNNYSNIISYIREKYPQFYNNEYNNKQKTLFPPNLYDYLRSKTNPYYRYLFMSKFKNFL
tara:strand:+ start:630 stop:1451 length:822 start_codon:yes stop_codon:yes gene_type:complete